MDSPEEANGFEAPQRRDVNIIVPPIVIQADSPPRPDGYCPLVGGLMIISGAVGFPREEAFWYLASGARRVDNAHAQFERVREGIEACKRKPTDIEAAFAVLRDAEQSVVALHRALEMCRDLERSLGLKVQEPLPPVLESKRDTVKEIRDAFEHIDDRALGYISQRTTNKVEAHTLFSDSFFSRTLLERRVIAYRHWSLGIDQEATELTIAVRHYLCAAWNQLFQGYMQTLDKQAQP